MLAPDLLQKFEMSYFSLGDGRLDRIIIDLIDGDIKLFVNIVDKIVEDLDI